MLDRKFIGFGILSLIFALHFPANATSKKQGEISRYHVVNHAAFTSLIDCETRLPVFVKYRTGHDIGNAKRFPQYLADPTLQQQRPRCHVQLNHRFKTYQARLSSLNINEQFDVGHLAMANHLDNDEVMIKEANYFTNLAPQVATKNRSGGAWYASEKIVECHRDIEPLINFVGVIDDPNTTDRDYFKDTFGQTTPDYWWRVIYFESSKQYAAWLMPNQKGVTELKFYSGEYDIDIAQLKQAVGIDIPEFDALKKAGVKRASSEFFRTDTAGQKVTCRGNTTNIG